MHRIPSAALIALVICAAPTRGHAQAWTAALPTPTVSFGVLGDLLGRVPTGLVGFDELQGRTVWPSGSGWVTQASAVPPRQLATLFNPTPFVYVFGGLDTITGAWRNDLWRYEPALGDWQLMTAGGATAPGPSPRFGCKAAPWDDSWAVVLFGGSDASGLRGDTWVMMPTTTAPSPPLWVPMATPAALTARTGHAMARAPAGRALLFGGDDGTLRGDTWLFDANGWTQHPGLGPPPATNCRMAYDASRDMTVLVQPNGSTWEWNGFDWRQVGTGGPPSWNDPALVFTGAPAHEVIAVQQATTGAGTVIWHYTPSPAMFDLTLDATCNVPGYPPLELTTYHRSLPILGQTFHLLVKGAPPNAFVVGAIELPPPIPIQVPLGCGCSATLSGVDAIASLVLGGPGPRDWLVPIANLPQLIGVPVAAQAFVIGASSPCWLMTTQGGQFVCGR